MKKNKIDLMAVKSALNDSRFREMLPSTFKDGVTKFLSNPTCPCNIPLYRSVLKDCKTQLKEYFPNREVDESQNFSSLIKNNWTIINCSIDELQKKLKSLKSGRKQIALSRYEDQVTVIVNDLEF